MPSPRGDTPREVRLNRLHARSYNFHPALDLSSLDSAARATLRHDDLSQATILGVFAPTGDLGQESALYSLSGRPDDALCFARDAVYPLDGSSPLDYGKATGEDLLLTPSDSLPEASFRAAMPRIVTYGRALMLHHGLWGIARPAQLMLGAKPQNMGEAIGVYLPAFRGYVPELIAYGRVLSPDERARVESYLAIKFGLTLRGSYFRSDGLLLWNAQANAHYHHRVTGLLRDDASGLHQHISTTSHEEPPRFSDRYDAYEDGNPHALPSRHRLLVIGRELEQALPEGGYLLWGDDAAPLTVNASASRPGVHRLARVWQARSNLDSAPAPEVTPLWQGVGLTISATGLTHQLAQRTAGRAHAVTAQPFPPGRGALSLTYWESPATVTLGVTRDPSAETCAAGYAILPQGMVYAVRNDTIQHSPLGRLAPGESLTVTRRGTMLSARLGGRWDPAYDLRLPDPEPCYGYAGIDSPDRPAGIADLREGDLRSTGHLVELGRMAGADALPPDRPGQTFLLIDPTGAGDFTTPAVRYAPCDSYDAARGKLCFRNVFFDTLCAFTFAYLEGLHAVVTPTNPRCDGGIPQANGKIAISVRAGAPAYSYRLTDSLSPEVPAHPVRAGRFISREHTLDSLPPGSYTLTLSASGGIQAIGHAGVSPTRAHSLCEGLPYRHAITWVSGATQGSYEIGLTIPLSHDRVEHGLLVEHGAVYPIAHGRRADAPLLQLQPGDSLTLRRDKRGYEIVVNGAVRWAGRLAFRHTLIRLPLRVNYLSGAPALHSLQSDAPDARWHHSPHVEVENSTPGRIVRQIRLEVECAPTLPPGFLMTRVEEGRYDYATR